MIFQPHHVTARDCCKTSQRAGTSQRCSHTSGGRRLCSREVVSSTTNSSEGCGRRNQHLRWLMICSAVTCPKTPPVSPSSSSNWSATVGLRADATATVCSCASCALASLSYSWTCFKSLPKAVSIASDEERGDNWIYLKTTSVPHLPSS